MNRYAASRRASRPPAATAGASARDSVRPRPGLRRRGSRPHAGDVLRRPADARLAGAGARRRSPTCCCSTSPPTTSTSSRSSGWSRRSSGSTPRRPRRARPLVPGGRRHRRARAGGRALALLQRHLARLAQGAGRARDRAGQGDRQAAGRDRAHGALHRALPLQGVQGAPGAVARQEARQDRAHRARPARRPRARLPVQGARALGPA